MRTILVAFIVFSYAPNSSAWGPRGHRIVAKIAQQHLNRAARSEIARMLGNDDLVSVSTWADEIKSERPATARWHYVDIPLQSSGFSDARDCAPLDSSHVGDCVVDRIGFFKGVLSDSHASLQTRAEALRFLVHLVADIHQPMHAAKEAEGGNQIRLIEFGSDRCGNRPCNLHLLWDVGLIQRHNISESRLLARIESRIRREHLQWKSGGTPESWANESLHLAQEAWLPDGARVDAAYFRRNVPIAENQLALAGLRLAALLNRALAPSRKPAIQHEVNHHAGDGYIQPQRVGPAGNRAMPVEAPAESVSQSHDHQRDDRSRQHGM